MSDEIRNDILRKRLHNGIDSIKKTSRSFFLSFKGHSLEQPRKGLQILWDISSYSFTSYSQIYKYEFEKGVVLDRTFSHTTINTQSHISVVSVRRNN